MIAGGLLVLLLQAQAVASPMETGCALVLRRDGVREVEPAPGLKIDGTVGRLTVASPAGAAIDAVWCDRASVIPQPGDHRGAEDRGLPLYVSAGGRTVVLRRSGEGWTLQLIDGPPLAPEEAAAGDAAVARINREHFGF